MDKKISFCPRCNKYLERGTWFCTFCGAMVPKLSIWESWSDDKKKEYLKESPHFNEPHPDKEDKIKAAEEFDTQYRTELAQEEARKQYVPTCPTCHSPDIEKISGTSKVVDAMIWGIWSKKAGKTFKCRNCGYEW